MSLTVRLREDLMAATKQGDALLKSVIRLSIAALKNAEIEKMAPLCEAEELEVMAKQVKQRRDAIDEYIRVGRPDRARAEQDQIDVMMRYLPEQLSEADVRTIVADAVAQIGASGPRDMGKVMGIIMPKVRGRADGKLVNQVVRDLLGA
ncbi:MAG: GatB/YqeY domain-containing protein [Clostridia bacterium]|nr:GatB/YqeY domain-containing protein [Clostridia bacterium]